MKHFISGIIIGLLAMSIAVQFFNVGSSSEEEKVAAYYANSTATLVSPHNIRERMVYGKQDFLLIDVRAVADYEREHIVTAVNIDTGTGAERTTDDVLKEFEELIAENPNKEIIIYCYSAACMNGRKVGNFLAENSIYVKEMAIGWNEWRYGWEMWNYDTEWETYSAEDFVVSGTEPGVVSSEVQTIAPCGVEGELSC